MPNQAHPRRAQREPHPDFALSLRRARQEEIRHVGAGDQQHQADDQHHQRARAQENTAQLRRNVRLVDGDEHFVPAAVVFRVFLFELNAQCVNGSLSLGERHIRFEPSNHGGQTKRALVEPILCQAGESLIMHQHRNPHVRTAQVPHIVKTARHHSDDAVFLPIKLNGSSQDLRIVAELAAPQRVAQNYYGSRRHVLLSRKAAAQHRLHAQNVEEICIHHFAEYLLFLAGDAEIQPGEYRDR